MGSERHEVVAGLDPIRTELAELTRAATLAAGLVLAASACSGAEPRTAAAAPPSIAEGWTQQPGLRVDSILPMEVQLARFRHGLPVVTALDNAARSADDLVRQFLTAVGKADTTALAGLTLSRSEYAWLYFPTSVYAAPPYELPPDLAWTLSRAASEKGASRVIRRLSGPRLRFHGYRCGQQASEGPNRFWRQCTVDYEHPAEGRVSRRLFATIMERDGRYKFLSYANDF